MSREFIFDVADIRLDKLLLQDKLNKVELYCSSKGIDICDLKRHDVNKLLFSRDFIEFIKFLIKEDYIPAILLIKGGLSDKQFNFIRSLCEYKFFNSISQYSKKDKLRYKESIYDVLYSEKVKLDLEQNIYYLEGSTFIDKFDYLIEHIEVTDLVYEECLLDIFYSNIIDTCVAR